MPDSRELMDDVHKALTERGWECGDDNDGGVMCFDIARYLLEVGWVHREEFPAQTAVVAAARAVVAVFEDIGRDGLELFDALDTLAARVRAMGKGER